ncbi:MlaD family protein [Nocardia inohanensis]|uniref:MlaD family protein n=1 Tax=Nocardia inohanensis TaxID=209246 RepID=UPI00082B70FC|nr:MlaD family protein [Nocardia inohanensis]
MRWRLPARLTVASALVLTLGGCTFDPAAVPVPGASVSGRTYPLHIVFANALNLPPGAKVQADGVEVGNLTGVHVTETTTTDGKAGRGYVVADIRIREGVRLPEDVNVELRQTTPLGDVHIAVTTPPRSTAPPLAPGATVPMSRTTRAPQVEDTMAGLATALGSGAVTDIQDTVRQLNAVLPADPHETARTFGVIGTDLTDVAGDLHSLDQMLDGLTSVTGVGTELLPTLQPMLTDDGTEHLVATTQAVINVFLMFSAMGPLAHSALYLAPTVAASDELARAFVPMLLGARPLDLSSASNLARANALIRDKLIPFAQHPAVNITTDQTDRVLDTLRMIGVVK